MHLSTEGKGQGEEEKEINTKEKQGVEGVRFYVSMFNTLLHHQKSRLVSILNLVMIDLFCLYVVGVHSFLCLSVGAQVWTILVVFSRNQLKCALILYSRDLFKNALKNYAVAIC